MLLEDRVLDGQKVSLLDYLVGVVLLCVQVEAFYFKKKKVQNKFS